MRFYWVVLCINGWNAMVVVYVQMIRAMHRLIVYANLVIREPNVQHHHVPLIVIYINRVNSVRVHVAAIPNGQLLCRVVLLGIVHVNVLYQYVVMEYRMLRVPHVSVMPTIV